MYYLLNMNTAAGLLSSDGDSQKKTASEDVFRKPVALKMNYTACLSTVESVRESREVSSDQVVYQTQLCRTAVITRDVTAKLIDDGGSHVSTEQQLQLDASQRRVAAADIESAPSCCNWHRVSAEQL